MHEAATTHIDLPLVQQTADTVFLLMNHTQSNKQLSKFLAQLHCVDLDQKLVAINDLLTSRSENEDEAELLSNIYQVLVQIEIKRGVVQSTS